MAYIVDLSENTPITLFPSQTVEEVLQNVRVILSTPRGSVPLARDWGIDMGFIDKPLTVAKTMAIAAIHDALSLEPRAVIKNITFTADNSGRLIPRVEVSVKDE